MLNQVISNKTNYIYRERVERLRAGCSKQFNGGPQEDEEGYDELNGEASKNIQNRHIPLPT